MLKRKQLLLLVLALCLAFYFASDSYQKSKPYGIKLRGQSPTVEEEPIVGGYIYNKALIVTKFYYSIFAPFIGGFSRPIA